jgi:hypothetical protein
MGRVVGCTYSQCLLLLTLLHASLLLCCLFLGLRDLLSAMPGLDDLQLGSCRSLSRGARQAAAAGVEQLKRCLQETAAADSEQPGRRRR